MEQIRELDSEELQIEEVDDLADSSDADDTKLYPPNDWLVGSSLPSKFSLTIIESALNELTPNNVSKIRWRLGNKELSQLWKWADQNPNALTDPQRVRTPAFTEYWKPLAEDMDLTAGIEAEYHHKNNRVYCWKGLRFSARQDLDGFSRFTEYGIEGVVPLELLPPDVWSKYQAKPSERSKRAKKEETKGAAHQGEENQIETPASEIDGEGSRVDLEASAAPMDTDAAMTSGNMSQGGTPTQDEQHKQSSDTTTDGGQEELGQIEADAEQAEAEAGMIDGEIEAEVDLDAVG